MKAITLWQPWASMIVYGWKPVEYRTHGRFSFLFGQQVAIHAGQKTDPELERIKKKFSHVNWKEMEPFPTGCILGFCNIMGVEHKPLKKLAVYRGKHKGYGYHLGKILRLRKPISASGKQGAWEWKAPARRLDIVSVRIKNGKPIK